MAASRLRGPGSPPVRLITKLGDDAHARALLAELERDAIDTRWCVRAAGGHATPASVVLVSGASRTIVHEPGLTKSAPLLPAEFDAEAAADGGEGGGEKAGAAPSRRPAWLEGASLVHLDGRHPAAAAHAARAARSEGVPILLDVERPRPGLDDLLPLADFVISSADFPTKHAAEASAPPAAAPPLGADGALQSPDRLAEYVLDRCPRARWVCVTLGVEGAIALERGRGRSLTRVPAWPLPADGPGAVRDTTGAGDAFIGAAAAGLGRGLALDEVLRLASYAAAANCCADGARGGMPRRDELPAELRALLDK